MLEILSMLMIVIFVLGILYTLKLVYRKFFPKKDVWDGTDVEPGYDMLNKRDREIQQKIKFKMNR